MICQKGADTAWDNHTGDQTLEEGLLRKVGVVLLEVLLGRRDELDGSKLVTVVGRVRAVLFPTCSFGRRCRRSTWRRLHTLCSRSG